MRGINYIEKDYDKIFLEMLQDSYQYHLTSTDERFLDYIQNRQDIENMFVMFFSIYAYKDAKQYKDMTKIYNSNDIDKAVGTELDVMGNRYGIPRPQAQKSSVELRFILNTTNNSQDFIIPKGTIVSTNNKGKSYYTTEEVVILRGTDTVYVEAISSNSGYNSRVDRYTLEYCDLNGVSVTNPKGSSGGREAYSDDEYRVLLRNRIYSYIKGTKEAYELFFSYYDGIDGYRLVPLWDGAGSLKIIIDPSDDWIIDDIQKKLLRNVELFDDDILVTGAVERLIDIDCTVNIDIDNPISSSELDKDTVKSLVENAIRVYIDGGYRRNGRYYKGLSIGDDLIPFQLGLFVGNEVPEVRSIDFKDTVKNIDNFLYANEFSNIATLSSEYNVHFDVEDNKLHGSHYQRAISPLIYSNYPYMIQSDNDGFIMKLINSDGNVLFETKQPNFKLENIDLYGGHIELEAYKDGATLSYIQIFEHDSDNDGYNTHICINDEEKCVSGNIIVKMQGELDITC